MSDKDNNGPKAAPNASEEKKSTPEETKGHKEFQPHV